MTAVSFGRVVMPPYKYDGAMNIAIIAWRYVVRVPSSKSAK